jgi:hypothetical protein
MTPSNGSQFLGQRKLEQCRQVLRHSVSLPDYPGGFRRLDFLLDSLILIVPLLAQIRRRLHYLSR